MNMNREAEGPLEGVRILDLSAVVSGPLATMILGDQGAEVIKVEAPGIGDTLRGFGALRGGISSTFVTLNRSKRSIVLDLRTEAGKEVLRDLVRWADVMIENYRPGVMERLGFDYERCRVLNEDLIYVGINGFGDEGPHAGRKVYDYVIQAIGGMAYAQADPETGRPELVRTLIFDKTTAYTAAQAISAALFARERGKGGQRIRIAMLDVALAFLWPDGMMSHTFLGDGAMNPPPFGKIYSLYETQDGFITFGALSDSEWQSICTAAERKDLAEDERFSTIMGRMMNLDDLRTVFREMVPEHTTEEWCKRFEANDVPHAPILPLSEVHKHPQVRANAILEESEHPAAGKFRQPLPAPKFSRTPAAPRRHAPLHGEHTDEVLSELGYPPERIEALRSAKAFG